jgi:hypothetical protein
MARRAYPSRRSGRAVYRTPSWIPFRPRRRRSAGSHAAGPSGTGTITGTAVLVGSGVKNVSGTGTLTGGAGLSGTGVKHAAGTCTVTGVTALSGTGVKGGVGAGTITGTVVLTGSGTKQSGIGSIPRPRIRWQLIAGPASGGYDLSLTEATGRRFTARLTDPSELGFGLDGRHPQATQVDELATDVHVLWTPSSGGTRVLFRGRVGATGDSIDDASHSVEVGALDYRALLNRRRLYSGSTLTWAATDQSAIAWGLIQQTQARTGGDFGIGRGVGQTTGILRDRTYEAGDSIGERVQELSEVIDGFDWDITPTSASGLAFDVWYPQRGADRGVVLEYGGLVKAVRREVDPSAYANAVRYTGSTDPVTVPVETESADIAARLEGRWDAVYGDDGLTTQTALDDRAAWQLAQAQVVQPVYTLTLRAGAWDGPDHIWLGDPVLVVVMSGRLSVITTLRVYEIAFTLGSSGDEGVEVTVGGPKPDYRRRPKATERRLTNLERR